MKINFLLPAFGWLMFAVSAPAAGNGLIVNAKDDAAAVKGAAQYLIDRLNMSLQRRDFSKTFYEKSFGRFTPREISVGKEHLSLLDFIEKFLVPNDVRSAPVISMASLAPRPTGENGTVFSVMLNIKGTVFTGGILFFSIENVTKLTNETYDVAVIPGRLFVGY